MGAVGCHGVYFCFFLGTSLSRRLHSSPHSFLVAMLCASSSSLILLIFDRQSFVSLLYCPLLSPFSYLSLPFSSQGGSIFVASLFSSLSQWIPVGQDPTPESRVLMAVRHSRNWCRWSPLLFYITCCYKRGTGLWVSKKLWLKSVIPVTVAVVEMANARVLLQSDSQDHSTTNYALCPHYVL